VKGQSSIEFLAYVSISMFILAVLYNVMAEKQVETFENQRQERAEQVADKVAFNVEMGLVQGEGYSRVFSLPTEISGEGYKVSVWKESVKLDWRQDSHVSPSRYRGDQIEFEVNDSANVFKVEHNSSGVFVVGQ